MDLEGKVAIVTGASSGIGAATARALARRGAAVVLAARRADRLRAMADAIERAGGRALAVPADVSRLDEIERMVRQAVDAYGRIDILVNNAGTGAGSSIFDDDAAIRHLIDVNLLAPVWCTRAVVPHMRRQGGGIVINIGSVAGEIAVNGLYSASKFGLRGFNDALRRELRRDNIAVVLIAPGFIRTAMTTGVRWPMLGPEAVARAAVAAIEHPRRTIFVPGYYAPLVWIARLLPGLVDSMARMRGLVRGDSLS